MNDVQLIALMAAILLEHGNIERAIDTAMEILDSACAKFKEEKRP